MTTSSSVERFARGIVHVGCGCLIVLLAEGETHVQQDVTPRLAERRCDDNGSDVNLRCGVVSVPEDRDGRSRRRIALNVLIVPAKSRPAEADPILLLHGGPGGAATRLYPGILTQLSSLAERRDLVFVDVRGAGQSNPLQCPPASPDEQMASAVLGFSEAMLRRCLSAMNADPRHYTTSEIIDDIEDVRKALGYTRLNLFGFSYGTRAALAFMRRYPAHVRSAVLYGAADVDVALPTSFAATAQAVLDGLESACRTGTPCGPGRLNLRSNIDQFLAGLERKPQSVRVTSQHGAVEFLMTRDVAAGGVVLMLYTQAGRERLAVVASRAARGDLAPFGQAIWEATTALFGQVSLGLFLSVTCSEDAPRITSMGTAKPIPTFLGEAMVRRHQAACGIWPRGHVRADVGGPTSLTTPTLVLSGALDPVTPPSVGKAVVERIAGAVHLVLPNEGHEFLFGPCARDMIDTTIRRGAPPALLPACIANEHGVP